MNQAREELVDDKKEEEKATPNWDKAGMQKTKKKKKSWDPKKSET